jgi:aminoglycoside 2'-N-acetyltransferase I
MVEISHTAQLERAALTAAEALLDEVFEGEFTPADWEHALGGVHALVWDGDVLVAHGAVVMRRLLHGGRALRAGYVEAVGVRASARRHGHGAAVMKALGGVIARAYDLGALGATDEAVALYERLGWRRWRGPLYALTPAGLERTPADEGGVFVLEAGIPLDLEGELACDWRDGDVW